ncbi:hypothetical protein JCM11491_004500 [Sporobolomyces phaffii]
MVAFAANDSASAASHDDEHATRDGPLDQPEALGEATTAKTKGKGKRRGSNAFGPSPIQSLPVECLLHVFAHLAPADLGTSQLVCREWNAVVSDETSWRRAFQVYYGVADPAACLARRVEPESTWRGEYIARVALARAWTRAKTSTVTSNPSLGALSSIHVLDPPGRSELTLLSVSLPLGAAVHSLPLTGKLSKRPLVCHPLDHLGRPLIPDLVASSPVSYCVLGGGERDAATRLVWGMMDGTLRVQNAQTALGGGARGSVGSSVEQGLVRVVPEAHRFGTEVQLVTGSNLGGGAGGKRLGAGGGGVKQRVDVFASVGQDGYVHIWTLDVPPSPTPGGGQRSPVAVKLWSARWDQPAVPSTPRVRATAIAFDAGWIGRHNGRRASLAVGTSQGQISMWSGINLDLDQHPPPPPVRPFVFERTEAIDTLVFDSTAALLVHTKGSNEFSKYDVSSASSIRRTVFRHAHLGDAITSIVVDFDDPAPLPPVAPASYPSTPGDATPPPSISLVPPRLVALDSSSSASRPLPIRANSTMTTSKHNQFGRKPFVVTGDDHGRVHVWDWTATSSSYVAEGEEQDAGGVAVTVVGPSKLVQGSEVSGSAGGLSGKVTALELTALGVFVGALDGTVRFYSLLGPSPATVMRTFKQRAAPRHATRMLGQGLIHDDDEERWHVGQICAGRDWVVASIGGKVLAWKTTEGKPGARKGSGGAMAGKGKLTPRQERFRANMELQHQVKESMSQLSNESSVRYRQYQQDQRLSRQFGLPPSLDNLTEEEAVAFAIMLSHEDQQPRSRPAAGDDDDEWEQPPQEWLADDGIVLEEDLHCSDDHWAQRRSSSSTHAVAFDDFDDDDEPSIEDDRGRRSLSTSLSVPPSPFSSHSWKPASPALSASFGGSPPSSNSKLHISPRLGPVYGSQNQFANDPVPDMDPLLWPTATASSSPPIVPAAISTIGTTSTSNSSRSGGTDTPIRRGWSTVVSSSSPAPSSRASPAASPSLTPSPAALRRPQHPASSTSLLSYDLLRTRNDLADRDREREEEEKRARLQRRDREEEELDADLKFALEMSLVEHVSRVEI